MASITFLPCNSIGSEWQGCDPDRDNEVPQRAESLDRVSEGELLEEPSLLCDRWRHDRNELRAATTDCGFDITPEPLATDELRYV